MFDMKMPWAVGFGRGEMEDWLLETLDILSPKGLNPTRRLFSPRSSEFTTNTIWQIWPPWKGEDTLLVWFE
jgi:hypothetical protein